MTTVYQFDIQHADQAGVLLEYQSDINQDASLSREEQAVLTELIRARFGLLNARVRPQQPPRPPA